MAYRKSPWRKLGASEILPVWTRSETNAVNLAFQALMSKFGITDTASYFRQLRIPIGISVVVCACIGAANNGTTGFILGGLAGNRRFRGVTADSNPAEQTGERG